MATQWKYKLSLSVLAATSNINWLSSSEVWRALLYDQGCSKHAQHDDKPSCSCMYFAHFVISQLSRQRERAQSASILRRTRAPWCAHTKLSAALARELCLRCKTLACMFPLIDLKAVLLWLQKVCTASEYVKMCWKKASLQTSPRLHNRNVSCRTMDAWTCVIFDIWIARVDFLVTDFYYLCCKLDTKLFSTSWLQVILSYVCINRWSLWNLKKIIPEGKHSLISEAANTKSIES